MDYVKGLCRLAAGERTALNALILAFKVLPVKVFHTTFDTHSAEPFFRQTIS